MNNSTQAYHSKTITGIVYQTRIVILQMNHKVEVSCVQYAIQMFNNHKYNAIYECYQAKGKAEAGTTNSWELKTLIFQKQHVNALRRPCGRFGACLQTTELKEEKHHTS